jgi:NAD(P)-dependent dehydrogenase (short-subunit alcohol dehydrogenase family)
MPVAGFDAAMALLVGSVMLGMKHAAPIMVWNRSGQHHQQRFDRMIYGAAKAAVNHLTRCVAMELGEHHVRVNSVSPGRLPRASSARRWAWERADADGATETFREIFAKAQPIPRAGILDDIAQCVLRLASDRSTFVNGTDIVIDGGVIGGRNYSQHHEGLDLVKAALGIKAP